MQEALASPRREAGTLRQSILNEIAVFAATTSWDGAAIIQVFS
jgi:hypothetical protein